MSEYWKSNPRKFCDFCKCWIADNKPSIEFHERGKRHKESLQKRLVELGRKGQEEYEAKMQEDDFIRSMEEAALKAYKTDIEQNPDMTGSKISEIAKASNAELVVGQKKAVEVSKQDSDTSETQKKGPTPRKKKWHEVKSPDGQSYFWNTETGETKWEEPEEGYISLKDQEPKNKRSNDSTTKTSKPSTGETKPKKQKTDSSLSAAPVVYGPAPRTEVYSSWQTVQREPDQQPVDLQLPQLPKEEYYGPDLVFKNSESSFEVKTVTFGSKEQGGGANSSVGFKKRKGVQDNRKIMQRRSDL